MALGPQYCKQLKEELRRHAVFPPNRPVNLGDYGVLRDHVFERLGNIGQLGITFQTIDGSGQSTFQFKSKGKVEFSLFGKGDIQPGGVAAIRAGIELKFGRANAVFFAAAGCTVRAIDDLRKIESALIVLLNQGRWEPDFHVVTEINQSARTTAIASADSDCEVKLDATSPALDVINLGDTTLQLQIKRSRNTALEVVTESGHIPLMQLAKLRGLFKNEFRPEAAAMGFAGSNLQLAPDSETAIPPTAPAMVVRPGLESAAAPQFVEPETAQFLRAAFESQPSDFELQRAINAYIPLLRATYDFAHGNENPPLPDGYEIVAPIRTSSQEAAQVSEALTPEAREAVQNDFRAMAEEQRRGSPQFAAESIPFPDRFGFVFREKQTDSLIVGIRGTQTPEEWVKNFTAVPSPWAEVPGFGWVHLGFQQIWRSVRGSVFAALGPIAENKQITFLGHSLGGAMATLGTVDIRKNLGRPSVDLCTVGCPRVGQVMFRINFDNLIHRCFRVVEELRDMVPHAPPAFLGFNHVGLQINVRSKVDNAHSLDSYLEGLQNFGRPLEVAPLAVPGLEAAAAPMATLAVRVL